MKAMNKAFILSASIGLVQTGILVAVYFFTDIRNLGHVSTAAFCVGTFILLALMQSRLANSYSPGYSTHPATLWMSLALVGVVLVCYLGTRDLPPVGATFLWLTVAALFSGFCLVGEAFDLVYEEKQKGEEYPTSKALLLLILAVPQVGVVLTAAIALTLGL